MNLSSWLFKYTLEDPEMLWTQCNLNSRNIPHTQIVAFATVPLEKKKNKADSSLREERIKAGLGLLMSQMAKEPAQLMVLCQTEPAAAVEGPLLVKIVTIWTSNRIRSLVH